jgi:hypothetical protein
MHEAVNQGLSYDDMEGIVTTLGVLAALILTCALPFVLLPMGDMALADYRNLLMGDSTFRRHTVKILRQAEFNFTFEYYLDEFIDFEQLLLAERNYDNYDLGNIGTGGWLSEIDYFFHHTKSNEQLINLAAIYCARFQKVQSWGSKNYSATFCISSQILEAAIVSITMLSVVLLGSIIIYGALALSPAKEAVEESNDGRPLAAFLTVGLPMLGVLAIMMIVGVVFFFICLADVVSAVSSTYKNYEWVSKFFLFGQTIPYSAIFLLASGLALYRSNAVYAEKGNPSTEEGSKIGAEDHQQDDRPPLPATQPVVSAGPPLNWRSSNQFNQVVAIDGSMNTKEGELRDASD